MSDNNSKLALLGNIAHRLRIGSITATQSSNSGHPTSCASMAELTAVLFFHAMKYSVNEPKSASNDRFVLSKGHAAPILYAAWAEAGLFPVSELLNLRKIDSDLEGHPTPRLNFVDVATGSLGQGLSCAAGMAFVGKYIDKAPYRVYCLIGDGESAEGSIWEALSFSSFYKLDNLCAIFDVNRLGQSQPTSLQHDIDVYRRRLDAFGFNAIVVDGHDIPEIIKAFDQAERTTGKPTAIIAKTYKGKDFPDIEDKENWHGKPLGGKADVVLKHLESLMKEASGKLIPIAPATVVPELNLKDLKLSRPPSYSPGEKVATRLAYGTALAKLAETSDRVIGLDGDTKNSTYADKIKAVNPKQFIECYIAEQNCVGVAIGAGCRGRTIPFVSAFACFFTRAFDQIRMGAISQTNVNFAGSHVGVSIGEDGPSQMGLEDIAMFRTVPGSTVFYPSDAVSCERAVELSANTKGICFIRTSRPATAVIYPNDEQFQVGRGKVVNKNVDDKILIVAAGVTLHEALSAAEKLASEKISVRIIDPFTVKPIDKGLIIENAKQVGGKIISVEDHYPEGGLGDAILDAVSEEPGIIVRKLAVREVPRSGSPDQLLEKYGISAGKIVDAVKSVLQL